MNKVDAVLERFSLDPLEAIDPSFTESFDEGQRFLEEAISEASTGVGKQNIFQKLMGLIRKLISWCSIQWTKLVNFFKKMFLRKAAKTTDQLIVEMGISRKTAKEKYGTTQRIQIPKDESSTMSIEDHIDLVFRPLQLEFGEDKRTIKFTLLGLMLKDGYHVGQGPIKAQKYAFPRMGAFGMCMEMINDPSKRDLITQLCRIVESRQLTEDFSTKSTELFDWYSKAAAQDLGGMIKRYEVSIDKIADFQRWLNETDQIIKQIEDPATSMETPDKPAFGFFYNTYVLQYLNNLSGILAGLQMTMNGITASISNVYMIDASYYGAISDVKQLGIFVKKCIDSGLPSKYLAYNAYLISDRSIRGEMSDARHPVWGQSRVTFFPPTNEAIVHKIALSGWGIRANYSERQVSDAIKNAGGDNLIAIVVGGTDDNTIIDAERLKSIKPIMVNPTKLLNLKKQLDDLIIKKNLPHNITSDIHKGNVGLKNGNLAALDYGLTQRNSLGAVTQ